MFLRIFQLLRDDGWYVASASLLKRITLVTRSFGVGRKLKAPGLLLGPRCTLRGLRYIQAGRNLRVGEGLWLEAIICSGDQSLPPKITIGDNVTISHWSHIAASHRVEIGDNVLIGSKVIITDHNHGVYGGIDCTSPLIPPALRPLDTKRCVIVGRNVWLGDGVVLTPDAVVGEGSVIGANSVVVGSIPPYSIAVGAPAKIIKKFDFVTSKWVISR